MSYHEPTHTCRLCGKWEDQNMVKYGVRHHAHYECYLNAGKTLDDLYTWQIGLFPFKLLKERGLSAYVEKRMADQAIADRRAKRGR